MAAASAGEEGPLAGFRRAVAEGWTFHGATGHLYLRLAGLNLRPAGASGPQAAAARLLSVALAERAAEEERFEVRKAFVDLSASGLTDEVLEVLLASWGELRLGRAAMCWKLQRNQLTDAALAALGAFAVSEAMGPVEEMHLSHQAGPEALSRAGVLGFLLRLAQSPKYPLWVKRRKAHRPVHLRMNNCGIEVPERVAEELESLTGARVCFADAQGCVRMACAHAGRGRGCPVAHLFDFRRQERPTKSELEAAAAAVAAAAATARADGDMPRQEKGKSFLCGSCGRSLPIDMFTRSQFQKAAHMDEERGQRSHLVRRCNDCVTQPCCACRAELPLSAFAGTQMLRPNGSRRCRPCAAFTLICSRCGVPKGPEAFAGIEDGRTSKSSKTVKICRACEGSNPYFERRHVFCQAFSGRYSAPPAQLPMFAREVMVRILAFTKEGRFMRVFRTGFECALCSRSWSFQTIGDDAPMERHARTSTVHQRRWASFERGHLVEIAGTGVEAVRFHDGLGIRGAFCGRQQVAEAEALVDVLQLRLSEPELSPEALRAAGCRAPGLGGEPEVRGPRWATHDQLRAARAWLAARSAQLEPPAPSTAPAASAPAAGAAPGSSCSQAASAASAAAEEAPRAAVWPWPSPGEEVANRGAADAWLASQRQAARCAEKLWRLCGPPAGAAEGEVDEDELEELRRYLARG